MENAPNYAGGSFAPPLSDEQLAAYKALAESTAGPVGDAMRTLLKCCLNWWNLPESTTVSKLHSSGRGQIVPLDEPIKAALYDDIPWDHELAAIQSLFDGIPAGHKALRDAAFHCLWVVKELNLDREPITADKL